MGKTERTHTPAQLAAQWKDGAGDDAKTTAAAARAWLDARREALRHDFVRTQDARAYVSGHSDAMDTLIAALFTCYGEGCAKGFAVAATGGYGRRELFPYSDIDLLFLHDRHTPETARVTERMLYVVWDMGLKAGHAYRSGRETLSLAAADTGLRTNLLDARMLCGDKALFTRFNTRFNKDIVQKTTLAFVEAKLTERDLRHKRFGDSRYMLEPNVKEGKGGLRDLHTLWWLARYAYPIGSLKDLVSRGLLAAEEYALLADAQAFLYRTRIHLHLLAGHAEERLGFERQHALALAMGFNHPNANKAIERFMRRYFVAVRTVGAVTRVVCALLEEEKKRKPRRPFAFLNPANRKTEDFHMDGERLSVRDEALFRERPVLLIGLFHAAQKQGVDIHPKTLHAVARNLALIDDRLRADPEANRIFLEILLHPSLTETTLRRMSEAGLLGRFIPDFGRAVGRTQFNRYHVYTVDEHTLLAIGNLHALENGLLREALPMASEAVGRIKMRRVLYVALFCHDIAKGRGGDHSELGARIAGKLARRFGFSEDEIDAARWLVERHLLFSETAFKRDLDDLKTLQDFVAEVQTPERLRLLLALTVVDIRAVAPDVWNEWKAALLRDLFNRAEEAMGAGQKGGRKARELSLREQLARHFPRWTERDTQAYIALLPAGFIRYFSEAEHMKIATLVKEAASIEAPLLIETSHDPARRVSEIILCTADKKGLFSMLAGAMTLAGAHIIGAKIFTLENGLAVDVFQVQNAAGGPFDRPDKLARMAALMRQAVMDDMDAAAAFAAHKKEFSYGKKQAAVPVQVFFDNEASNVCTVIEVNAANRAGLLYAMTRALAGEGISIATAHISTYGTQVSDVFYVKDQFGLKITHALRLEGLRRAVQDAVLG